MTELEAYFRKSFEDILFSSAERKALRKILKEEPLTDRETKVLRSRIFDIAREGIDSTLMLRILDWLENANKLISPKVTESVRHEVYFSPGR